MPPLATLLLGLVIVVCFTRACMRNQRRFDIRQPPFITDITHGICPRCGDRGRSACDGFWALFSCSGCGYHVDTHLEDIERS